MADDAREWLDKHTAPSKGAAGNGWQVGYLAGLQAAAAGDRSVGAEMVMVDRADLAIVLDQRSAHAHRRPGIWDDDNRPGVAGTACRECAARERLRAATAATPASAGEPKAQTKDLRGVDRG